MAEDKKEEAGSSEASSGKNPLLIVLVLLNTIAVGAVGFFQFQNHKKLNSLPTVQDLMNQQMAGGEHGAGGGEAAGGAHGEAKPAEGGHGEAAAGGAHGEAKASEGLLYPLDPFTANLAQGDGPRRYIRMTVVLKFSKTTKKEEVDVRKPQISDSIITMLNSKKPEELLKAEGKTYLKEEIKNAINNFLVDGAVEDVYYVGFQIN